MSSINSVEKYKGSAKDIYKDVKGDAKDQYQIESWKIHSVPSSLLNGGFFVCPHCGSSFSNILWIPKKEDKTNGYLKCTKCQTATYMDFKGSKDEGVDPMQDIKVKVKEEEKKKKT